MHHIIYKIRAIKICIISICFEKFYNLKYIIGYLRKRFLTFIVDGKTNPCIKSFLYTYIYQPLKMA